MISLRLRYAGIALVLTLVIAACNPGTIGRDEAIAIATREAGPGSSVINTEFGAHGALAEPAARPGIERPEELVWAITLRGKFALECPATPDRPRICPDLNWVRMILDGRTGAFISASYELR